jgi:hypothetical protein
MKKKASTPLKNKEGAQPHNQNGLAIKDKKLRQEAYRQYCAHLAQGKSKKSWYFEHSELTCTWETMEKYIANEVEFDPLQKKIAEASGYGRWEGVVEDSAIGRNKDANTASLQMLMRNKFGWDKQADKQESIDPNTSKLHEQLMEQLRNSQSLLKRDESSSSSEQKS